jgi:hypothetical protein
MISVIMHTCRGDNTRGMPEPVLDMLVSSMMAQDYKGEFEVIVVDLLYEVRKGYFDKMALPFPVIHVPDRSTPFKDEKYMRISSPKNTGVMYARGEFVVFTDDCQIFPTHTLSIYAEWAKQGVGCNVWYKRQTAGNVTGIDNRGDHLGIPEGQAKIVPVSHIGYIGSTATMLPIEQVLQVNGWDEMYDGTRQLEDCDFVLRLEKTGLQVAYERRVQITECEPVGGSNYDPQVVIPSKQVKCNGAYSEFIWQKGRMRANTTEFLEEAIAHMHWENCLRWREDNKCHPYMSDCTKKEYDYKLDLYRDPRLVFDLRELRNETLSQLK